MPSSQDRRCQPNKCSKMYNMLGSLLLLALLILPSALPQFTISTKNRVTTHSTTTESFPYRAIDDPKYTWVPHVKEKKIACHTAIYCCS